MKVHAEVMKYLHTNQYNPFKIFIFFLSLPLKMNLKKSHIHCNEKFFEIGLKHLYPFWGGE